ncbi:MAG: MarR family transcriptional regulator [Chrysiogenetes bacterium]|nr:MarR family transcriptional regulator [Chrysiogenetes bacterium]
MGTKHQGTTKETRALNAYIPLMRSTQRLEVHLSRALAEHDLTISQLGVLEALLHLGPMSQTALGEKLLRTGGSVTVCVNRLEKRGLVERRRSQSDGRVQILHLTPTGRRHIKKVFPVHVDGIVQTMGALSASEQAELMRLCKKIGKALPKD